MTRLETNRLTLRMWQPDDFDRYAEMFSDPDVMRFLSRDGQPMSRFDAWRSFSAHIGHWHLRGFGMFAVVEKSDERLAGRIGPWQPEGWPGFEIGWTLHRDYWGNGYATEAVEACIRWSFSELDRPYVISLIDPENSRSIRVAERVGEQFECTVSLPHMAHLPDKAVLQYGLRREDWLG